MCLGIECIEDVVFVDVCVVFDDYDVAVVVEGYLIFVV